MSSQRPRPSQRCHWIAYVEGPFVHEPAAAVSVPPSVGTASAITVGGVRSTGRGGRIAAVRAEVAVAVPPPMRVLLLAVARGGWGGPRAGGGGGGGGAPAGGGG